MVEQREIIIGDVKIPIIIEDGITYYPISYLSEKILLRQSFVTNKNSKYNIKKFEIKFSDINIQISNCIREEELKERLLSTQKIRLNTAQVNSQNVLHKYLKIRILYGKKDYINKLPKKEYKLYDEYTLNLINEFKNNFNEVQFQLCNSCDKYFPLDGNFYRTDNRLIYGHCKICLICDGRVQVFKSDRSKISNLENFKKFTVGKDVIEIYKAYYDGLIDFIPIGFLNKEEYLKIINWLLRECILDVKDLNISHLKEQYKLSGIGEFFNTKGIHYIIFGENSYYYPWKYPSINRGKIHSNEFAKKVFDNYLAEYQIQIIDKYTFNYGEIIKKSKIKLYDLLKFVVYYNDYKDAGYKYAVGGTNYYKDDENVLFDLRYLIEKDMNIDLNKIPLYITKSVLAKQAGALHTYLIVKKKDKIFKWIDKLYPNKFVELDFDISYYRENFDSIEEGQIHELLVTELKNVIYNCKIDGKRLITIEKMQPDWILIRVDKCWIIEYFGMYFEKDKSSEMIKNYTTNTKAKIEKYEKLDYYGKIFFYPDDLKDNFQGIKDKIAILK